MKFGERLSRILRLCVRRDCNNTLKLSADSGSQATRYGRSHLDNVKRNDERKRAAPPAGQWYILTTTHFSTLKVPTFFFTFSTTAYININKQ